MEQEHGERSDEAVGGAVALAVEAERALTAAAVVPMR
jgi:hypothetical protein